MGDDRTSPQRRPNGLPPSFALLALTAATLAGIFHTKLLHMLLVVAIRTSQTVCRPVSALILGVVSVSTHVHTNFAI